MDHGKARAQNASSSWPHNAPARALWPAFATELGEIVGYALKHWPVDPARVYATGLSLGGFGVWAAASANPGMFAALVPICGAFTLPVSHDVGLSALLSRSKFAAVKAEEIAPLRELPVWLFHGDRDKTVDINGSKAAFAALGGRPSPHLQMTIYKDVGHHCWKAAYSTPDLYTWMLKHKQDIDASGGSRIANGSLLGVRERSRSRDSADSRIVDIARRDLHSMQALLPALGPAEVLSEEDDDDDSGDEDTEDMHRKQVARWMRTHIRRAHLASTSTPRGGVAESSKPGGGAPSRDTERERGEKEGQSDAWAIAQ
eukprot:CAMPEP_0115284288 /NCGR_PEP_ID=MMETSP0270-20121206/60816_1 /TAXON_ID=71861 /ORGANISM="Scrippsiella trochoidea, Strain CCMP3099" /LENGTH=314 /DNA_ID=CAMNT_0002701231 /DNA_START=177 /DNA_END=1118 /DNA_ORIENTATION=+